MAEDDLDLYGDLYGEDENEFHDAQDSDNKGAATEPAALGAATLGSSESTLSQLTSSVMSAPGGPDTRHDSTRYIQKSADQKDEGKMFVGGLNWDTTDEGLKEYFEQFGTVSHSVVMRDPESGRSRGFAFITFDNSTGVDNVLAQAEHILDGKHIDPKRAVPRTESSKTDKLFVRSIPPSCTPEYFKQYFKQFGKVLDATLMMEKETERHRGFGFVNFEEGDAVDKIIRTQPHYMDGQPLEVKRAQARADQSRRFNDRGPRFPERYDSGPPPSADPTGVTDLLTQMGLAAGMMPGVAPGAPPPMPYGPPGYRGGFRGGFRGRGAFPRGGPPAFRGRGGRHFNRDAGSSPVPLPEGQNRYQRGAGSRDPSVDNGPTDYDAY